MIEVVYETDYEVSDITKYTEWLKNIILSEGKIPGNLCFIISTDENVLKINQEYLGHTDLTDVITFDYTEGDELNGDIFMSLDRIKENAEVYEVEMDNELRRVMAHGVLHLMGYSDKSADEKSIMRAKEDEKLKMFHVEQ
ncbi:MAG: rRNA maturation RNase YbeY [Eudoraea sp.]|nr:rRNA maturation RNase YbeY [Eudoraea sp.]